MNMINPLFKNIKLSFFFITNLFFFLIFNINYLVKANFGNDESSYLNLYNEFLRDNKNYNLEVEKIANLELNRFKGQTYLDYTGSGLYQKSQLEEIYNDLITNSYGNAHSRNPSAELTDKSLTEARNHLFRFFNINSKIYSIIFTGGATGGLKLVGEDFPWNKNSKFYYLRINHNSVLGIREYATLAGAEFKALSFNDVENILFERKKKNKLNNNNSNKNNNTNINNCLFAFPGKDNFAGEKYPLRWINEIQKYGLSDGCKWSVLLDAAALAPTEKINMEDYPADFMVVSFYKMFGYPTGLGALIIKIEEASKLNKIYFGGGTVVMASCDSRWCKIRENPSAKFEDGTVSFLSIVSLKYGLKKLEYFGMDKISKHVASLSLFTFKKMSQFRHFSGKNVIQFYGRFNSPPTGGIINFNILHPDGTYVHFAQVEQLASMNNIHLRTGCFCNPGGCQDFLGLTLEEIQMTSDIRESCSDPSVYLKNRPVGSVRISFGYLSTFKDAFNFLQFIEKNFIH